MYCPKCKNMNKENSKYCSSCGTKINNIQIDEDDSIKRKINILLLIGFIFSFLFPLFGLIISIIGVIIAYRYIKKYDDEVKNLRYGVSGIILSMFFIIIYGAIFNILINFKNDRYDYQIFGEYKCENLSPSNIILEDGTLKVIKDNNEVQVGSYELIKRHIKNNKCFEYTLMYNSNTQSGNNVLNTSKEVEIRRCNDISTISFDKYKTYECIKKR